MTKTILKMKFWVILGLCFALALPYSNAYARGHHQRNYHYRGGKWYSRSWLWFDVAVAGLAIGAVIASLPQGHRTVVVGGSPYYYYDGYYFSPCPSGYVVVPTPALAPAVAARPAAPVVQPVNPNYVPVTKIAEMALQNVPDVVIINEIQRTNSVYNLNSEIITYLKQNKVSDAVIDYMMGTQSNR